MNTLMGKNISLSRRRWIVSALILLAYVSFSLSSMNSEAAERTCIMTSDLHNQLTVTKINSD
ncbi:hypothetical protein J2X05_002090 [Cellvibrio fibrivorans]|jgi:hypothetical protein|uniref:Uncharacterized protein n=1 Tax=Cellvibrio fibrivorans TaxID=126350 RepID=A0ABU1UY41_9GAMM|nr:hypothetical protein [Cellvibrio fibrivorans]